MVEGTTLPNLKQIFQTSVKVHYQSNH